ncbi:hypothetical protein B296_00012448, partial [Ensete ventricosum]
GCRLYVSTIVACATTVLYSRLARRHLFPQPSLVAMGGHLLASATTSTRDNAFTGGSVATCTTTVCGLAHGRRLCATAARTWTPLYNGVAAVGLLFVLSRCVHLLAVHGRGYAAAVAVDNE